MINENHGIACLCPNKFPPLHFVPNRMNKVPSTMNREDTPWSILPTHKVTPTII